MTDQTSTAAACPHGNLITSDARACFACMSVGAKPAPATHKDGWDDAYWPQHEVCAPSWLHQCPVCGALIGDYSSAQEKHVAWHRAHGDPAPSR